MMASIILSFTNTHGEIGSTAVKHMSSIVLFGKTKLHDTRHKDNRKIEFIYDIILVKRFNKD